jgi:hypothetical protein
MESADLKALWAESNRRLEATLRLNAVLMAQNLRTAKTGLNGLMREVALELAINVAGIALLGAFAAAYIAEPRFFIPAVALDLYAIALIVLGGRQLAAIRSIDYVAPVTTVQSQLEALRILRIRTTQVTLLFAPVMWVPLAIVLLKGLAGVDLYAAGTGWLFANAFFGLAVIPIAIYVAKRFGARLNRNRALRYIADTIAGRNLTDALASLDAVRRFEDA